MKYLPVAFIFISALSACTSNSGNVDKPADPAQNSGAVQPVVSVRKQIVFFGNSLTAAYRLSPEEGFTAIIQRRIDSLGLPYTCVNAGLSGETTTDGANRIDWVLQQPIDIFVLELGGNDALRGLPVQESKKNLQTIIDKVKARYPGSKIIIAGMLAPPNLGPAYTNAFRDLYTDLAGTNRVTLIPFLLEGVGGIADLNLEDGIHPNVKGQKIVAETVWKTLQPLL